MHTGGGGRVNIIPPQANFKTLVNKNNKAFSKKLSKGK
jgi:hypothetical protein